MQVIANALPIKSMDTYNASIIKEAVKDIKNLAEQNGYSFIEINPVLEKDTDNNNISVNIILNEGPRVYVDNIDIQVILGLLTGYKARVFAVRG